MPRAGSVVGSAAAGGVAGGEEDFASSDEVKVYKDEGDDEKRASENLTEDKIGLVTETEEGKVSEGDGPNSYTVDLAAAAAMTGAKTLEYHLRDFAFGYPMINPYPTTSSVSSPSQLLPPSSHPGFGLYMYGSTPVLQPPPAHMGIASLSFDLKAGLPGHPIYGLPPPPGHLFYGNDVASSLHGSAGGCFRGPFSMGMNDPGLPWFPPPGIFAAHPGISHPAVVGCGPTKDLSPLSDSIENSRNRRHGGFIVQTDLPFAGAKAKRSHIKKPLNAFMIFMKEMRQSVIDECTLKESAAINQILGRRWHALERSEQAKYYEMARKEKELHMQLYPGWSARDNYASRAKKKKPKRDFRCDGLGGTSCDEEPRSPDCKRFEGSPDCKRFEGCYQTNQRDNWSNLFQSQSENTRDDISLSKLSAAVDKCSDQSSMAISIRTDL